MVPSTFHTPFFFMVTGLLLLIWVPSWLTVTIFVWYLVSNSLLLSLWSSWSPWKEEESELDNSKKLKLETLTSPMGAGRGARKCGSKRQSPGYQVAIAEKDGRVLLQERLVPIQGTFWPPWEEFRLNLLFTTLFLWTKQFIPPQSKFQHMQVWTYLVSRW